jgi:hypothetical protein
LDWILIQIGLSLNIKVQNLNKFGKMIKNVNLSGEYKYQNRSVFLELFMFIYPKMSFQASIIDLKSPPMSVQCISGISSTTKGKNL